MKTSEVGSPAEQLPHPPQPPHISPTSRVGVSARPVGLQVSGPAAWDKASINCGAVQRARGTKGPTRCPCPQTRPETNVTGLAQKGIIRPVSLNTFTYLRVFSAPCFVLAQEEGRAWMEGREEEVGTLAGGDVSVCECVRMEEGKWTNEMNERSSRFPQRPPEPRKHHRVCKGMGGGVCVSVCVCVCVCVCSPPTRTPGGLVDCCVLFFFWPLAPLSPPLSLLPFLGSF